MLNLLYDLQYAFRTFRQNSIFTIVIVLSLALGIGANTALFSLVDAMFLRKIPVANADELVVFGWQSGPSAAAFSPTGRGIFWLEKFLQKRGDALHRDGCAAFIHERRVARDGVAEGCRSFRAQDEVR